MEISILKWDSGFFKKAVVKVDINGDKDVNIAESIKYCKEQHYQLLYVFVDSNNLIVANKIKAYLGVPINQKIILHVNNLTEINIAAQSNENLQITNAKQTTLPADFYYQILDLTLTAGAYSRFKLDEKIEAIFFEEMYRIWVNSLVYGENYRIIVAKKKDDSNNEIIGFLAYKILDEGYQIDFMSIKEDYKSQGLGKALVKKMTEEISGNNYVVTEIHKDNIGIFSFFSSLGFTVKQSIDIYHVHL
jgi:ribosomal protein S18 acetylase RimI-like enzyme